MPRAAPVILIEVSPLQGRACPEKISAALLPGVDLQRSLAAVILGQVLRALGNCPAGQSEPELLEYPLLAGFCRPLHPSVRPLSNALRAFNARPPLAPYGVGNERSSRLAIADGGHGWIDARRDYH